MTCAPAAALAAVIAAFSAAGSQAIVTFCDRLAVGADDCCGLGSTPQYRPTAVATPRMGKSWLAEIRREGCLSCGFCGREGRTIKTSSRSDSRTGQETVTSIEFCELLCGERV